MNYLKNMLLITLSTALTLLAGCASTGSCPVKITKKTEGYLITENNKKILFYQTCPTKLSDHIKLDPDNQTSLTLSNILRIFDSSTRPNYVHPLFGLDEEILTQDYALTDHREHPHHGIFWAWRQTLVNGKQMGDSWNLKDFVWDIYDVEILYDDSQSAAIRAHVLWKSPDLTDSAGLQIPFVKETTTIRAWPESENLRKIDFEISLIALLDNVRIGGSDNEKGFGGFAARINASDSTIFTGQNGPLKPQRLPLQAGPWVDFSDDFQANGNISGLTILCHNSIPGYPTPWLLRQKRSMQNPAFPGRSPIPLSRKKPLILKYRIIIHKGTLSIPQINNLLNEFNEK